MTKALVLFSWWLDSLLAIKVLQKQGIDCTAIVFTTPFFKADTARKYAKQEWFILIEKDISKSQFQIVKNPKYWYGKNMNPCIDCHWLMMQIALKIMEDEWFDIIASWEVVWQRPKSQTKSALDTVKKIAWKDILRPLSAKLLKPTEYEENWLVDRTQLLDITWKSRKPQIKLAKDFWLENFEKPAWGCLLTNIWYSNKLKELVSKLKENTTYKDAELLKYWILKFIQLDWKLSFFIISRDANSSEFIKNFFDIQDPNEWYFICHITNIAGPVIIWKHLEKTNLPIIKDKIIQELRKKSSEKFSWNLQLDVVVK